MAVSTLVIGVGGTGTLSVRAAKKRYCELRPADRVPAQFLAIDFDRSALTAEEGSGPFAKLEEDDFLYLNPTGIQDLLRNLDRTHDGGLAWANVLEWFPERERAPIPISEVEANGANQLRALGRLGFFLNDGLIETTLRRKLGALNTAVDTIRMSSAKRVMLVSSLAGGTGGGLLLDIAYIARRLEGRPRVFLYLLLPDVFLDVDSGGRILQNGYAFLKELAYLKDQQLPFRARYLNIAPADVGVGQEEPFARLFLFGGASGAGSDPIRASCDHMAAAILGQLHRKLQEKTLAIVANVVSGSKKDEEARRRTHCFSTSGSRFLSVNEYPLDAATLLHWIVRAVLDPPPVDEAPEGYVREMLAAFEQRLDQQRAQVGLAPASSQAASDGSRAPVDPTASAPQPAADVKPDEQRQLKALIRGFEEWADRLSTSAAETQASELRGALDTVRRCLRATDFMIEKEPAATADAAAAPAAMSDTPRSRAQARARLQQYHALLLAAGDAGTLAARGGWLAELESHRAAIESARQSVATVVGALTEPADVRTLLARREYLERLGHLTAALRAPVVVAEDALAGLRDEWDASLRGEQTVRSRSPFRECLVLDQQCVTLKRALGEAPVKARLAQVMRLRIGELVAARIDALKRVEEARREPYRRAFLDLPGSERSSAAISRLPQRIQERVEGALRRCLPKLLEGAYEFMEQARRKGGGDSPAARQERLLKLLERVQREDPDLSQAQFGIEDVEDLREKIRKLLVEARQRVFERRTPNPQRKGFAMVLVPKGMYGLGEHLTDDSGCRDGRESRPGTAARNSLKEFLTAIVTQVLGVRCQLEEHESDQIWLYYEDLFNPPEHIRNLDDYYRAYKDSPIPELFHIDRRYLADPAFLEIHSGTSRPILCGNDGCRENIAGVERGERICPACQQVIRSRCGNPSCHADDVHERERPLGARGERGEPAKECPACGEFNHGAWWMCARHDKVGYEVSIDKQRCPRCVALHQEDPVGYPDECVSVRPDIRSRRYCPRCVDLQRERSQHKVFEIPRELLRFYHDGVNGHDLNEFPKWARTHRLSEGVRCPSCRTLLIPVHHHRWAKAADDPCARDGRECHCVAAEPLPMAGSC